MNTQDKDILERLGHFIKQRLKLRSKETKTGLVSFFLIETYQNLNKTHFTLYVCMHYL